MLHSTNRPAITGLSAHNAHCRVAKAPEYPERQRVPDDLLDWGIPFPNYAPADFTSASVLAHDRSVDPTDLSLWADPLDPRAVARKFVSFEAPVRVEPESGRPLNVCGRTGLAGRGRLGNWGANFAVDILLTRDNPESGELEMVVIERADTGAWAPPGGFLDAADSSEVAAQERELHEETGIRLSLARARVGYKGYVDDYRNTDHAWIETTLGHLHLGKDEAATIAPIGGDDARRAFWSPVNDETLGKFRANHAAIVRAALRRTGFVSDF